MNFKKFLLAVVLLSFCIVIPNSSEAVIHDISILNFSFSPTNTQVSVGDTVRWTWDSGSIPHSTTSDGSSPKAWDSGVFSTSGTTFMLIFDGNDPFGAYPYHCSVHASMVDTLWLVAPDNDGDGFRADVDCDDSEFNIHPGAPEIPDDGIDQDCNGVDAVTCFVDNDQDSYGSFTTTVALDGTCDLLDDESTVDGDCHDNDPAIHPGAFDIPNNGIDEDCDGLDATSCCTDPTGDINNDGGSAADISDLLYLVDYMFTPGSPPPACMAEADVNGDGGAVPDISDLLFLVDYMFTPGSPAPANCL